MNSQQRCNAHCIALLRTLYDGGWDWMLEPGQIGYRCVLIRDLWELQVAFLEKEGLEVFDESSNNDPNNIWVTIRKAQA